MDIYEVLSTKPHSERHLARYVKFIQSRTLQEGPLERHHICPRAKDLFPEFANLTDHTWNAIDLTRREHYIAHLLLWKTFGGSQGYAIRYMTAKHKRKSRLYAKSRAEVVRANIGRKHKPETIAKMNGRIVTEQTKSKMRLRKHSEETRTKMSESRRKRPPFSEETKAKLRLAWEKRKLKA